MSSTPDAEEAHIFLLVHGLWGSPTHMLTIEKAVKNSLSGISKERIVTIRPSSFRFWKTYDGIQICAEKAIADLLYEIETLKVKNNCKVVKISIVGYSLGGLISRYVVGMLYEMGFFDEVKPVFFCTFATPHVGVHFFRKNFFDRFANFLGKYMFGKTGFQLFVSDSPLLLVEMSQPGSRYFEGLLKFEKLLLLANVRNDRSVAFYTSYITDHSPFDLWNTVNIKYLRDLPTSRIGKAKVRPKFIDLQRSHKVTSPAEHSGNLQEETSIFFRNKALRWTVVLAASSILVPFYIPLILCLSLYVSGYSLVKIRILLPPQVLKHWEEVKKSVFQGGEIDAQHAKQGETRRLQRHNLTRQESFKGDTSNFTENAMENMLFAEDRFVNQPGKLISEEEESTEDQETAADTPEELSDSDDNSKTNTSIIASFMKKSILDIQTEENDKIILEHLEMLRVDDYSEFPLFEETTKLDLSENEKTIVKNLNSLDWIKIPVYHNQFNAHDGIVARRGEQSCPKGTCTIYLWGSILRNHLKESTTSTNYGSH